MLFHCSPASVRPTDLLPPNAKLSVAPAARVGSDRRSLALSSLTVAMALVLGACGGSTQAAAGSGAQELPDNYQPAEKLPVDGAPNATLIALDEPCGTSKLTARAVFASLPNRSVVDYAFVSKDESTRSPAKVELQLDLTLASCTLGIAEDRSPDPRLPPTGGLIPDAISVRGIFLIATNDGVHSLRIAATLHCDLTSDRVECNVFGHAPAQNQRGSFLPPATATDAASYWLNGRVGRNLSLGWESGREDLADSELSANVVELGSLDR